MKIRVISDLHVDINNGFPFSLRQQEKDIFALIPGDVSGNVKLTAKWVKQNIHNGMFIVGNHDPSYNELGKTIKQQKEFLHERFPEDGDVTFMDEQVGVMSKMIPNTNILVIGSTLYTDYQYANETTKQTLEYANKDREKYGEELLTIEGINKSAGARGLNDFRWGHTEDEFDDRGLKQRLVRPDDYKKWFDITLKKISDLVEENKDKDIIVMTHHCPSPSCICERYVRNNMNASYISDLEKFITDRPNIRAWCCGHIHNTSITELGDNHQLIVCNPRGYERQLESEKWNPNTFIDTDTWKVVTEPYENKRLEEKRKEAYDRFMKYASLFI